MTSEYEVLPEEATEASVDAEGEAQPVAKPVYTGPSPGQLLREERERRQLTLEDVVTQSRMSMETVKALEEDRDPPQNAWVYVRGYYRKYARVLELAEDDILTAHEKFAGGAPEREPLSTEWAPQDVSPSAGVPKFILVLIAGIIFGGLAWWGMPYIMNDEASQPEDSIEIDVSEGQVSQPSATEVTTTVASVEVAETPVESVVPSHEEAVSEQEVASEEAADAQVEETEAADSVAAPETAHEDAAAATGLPKLALEFIERSWVNVVDSEGKKLLDGIVQADAQFALEGQPPFKVFLGYAPGVKVSYKGEMIDVSRHTTSSNTARFTVGAEPAATP